MAVVRIPRQSVPTSAKVLLPSLTLMYLEICNDTDAPIKFGAWDADGLCVIPNQDVQARGVLTYEAKFGNLVFGLQWKASAQGLVGWAQGEI